MKGWRAFISLLLVSLTMASGPGTTRSSGGPSSAPALPVSSPFEKANVPGEDDADAVIRPLGVYPGWWTPAQEGVRKFEHPLPADALVGGRQHEHDEANTGRFTFAVTADPRYYSGPDYDTSDYFRGVCEAIDGLGKGAFMVSPGDIDPVDDVYWTITSTLGATYTWYPAVGNHELPCGPPSNNCRDPYYGANMDWLNSYDYGPVNRGPTGCPTTTYSFDYGDAHLAVLNEYCDGEGETHAQAGDVSDHLYEWLVTDLQATDKSHIFVLGHEPAYPQPDADGGPGAPYRHADDSLNRFPKHRNRFWDLLKREGVLAYICGHTHTYSAVNVEGVWQLDAAHARGTAQKADEGRSSFIMIHVDGDLVTFETYRLDAEGGDYTVAHSGTLACPTCSILSFQDGVSPTVSYAGTRDTTIYDGSPNTNYGADETLIVDGGENRQAAILQWDTSPIPPGSTIEAASITFSVTNTSTHVYELYEMKRDWVETEATWMSYTHSLAWQIPGAGGDGDKGSDELGAISAWFTGTYVVGLNHDGVALVQDWAGHPATNDGLIMVNYENTDSVRFDSREVPLAASRPRLTLFYVGIPHNPVLEVVKDGPAAASVGDTVVYTFTVGHDAASDGSPVNTVSVSDDIAGTATYVSGDDNDGLLEVGETWIYTASQTIQPLDPDPLVNTVTVQGQDLDGDPVSHSDSHSLDVAYNPVLEVVKDGPAAASVGEIVVYTFTVGHDAASDSSPVSDVSVTDDLAGAATYVSGDDNDGLLEVGETWIYTASHAVQPVDPDPLVNTAVIEGQDRDGDPVSAAGSHQMEVIHESSTYLPVVLKSF